MSDNRPARSIIEALLQEQRRVEERIRPSEREKRDDIKACLEAYVIYDQIGRGAKYRRGMDPIEDE